MAERNGIPVRSKNGSRRGFYITGATLLAIVLLVIVLIGRRGTPTVRTERATRSDVVVSISTNGKVEPVNDFQAHAPIATTIRKIYVKTGDRVKKGALLLTLDDAGVRADAARALALVRGADAEQSALTAGGTKEEVLTRQSELVKAQTDRDASARNLDALRRLAQRGAASPAEVQAAENQMKVAEAAVRLLQQKATERYSPQDAGRVQAQAEQARAAYRAAQATLAETNVRAGTDGIVYILPLREGAFVNPGDLLVGVANLEVVQVRAFIDEPDVGRIARNENARISWDALPGRAWTGVITSVPTTVVQRGTRTVGEILCQVPNADLKLLPNINVTVSITTAEARNVLTVPREAVRQDTTKYVYEVVKDKLQRRNVQTGLSNLTRTEIASGLRDDSVVAISSYGMQPLRNGMRIKLQRP